MTEKVLDDYYAEHVEKKCADKVRQRNAIANLKQHFLCEVKAIDIPMCRRYVERRQSGDICLRGHRREKIALPATESTARRELVVLTAAVAHAVKWKRLPAADVPHIELPPDGQAKERWLTHDELARVRAAAERQIVDLRTARASRKPDDATDYDIYIEVAERTRDFIELAYYTASRRDAVERLTVFQVDLKANRIRLAKDGERETKKRRPVVRIDPALRPTVERLVEEARAAGREWLLGAPRSLYRPFVRVCELAGVKDVSPHVLRHTRASHLLQAGVDIWEVAKLLGDTVATVERVYGHHAADYQAAIERKEDANG